MSYAGRRAEFVFVDEMRSMTDHQLDAMSYMMSNPSATVSGFRQAFPGIAQVWREIKPLEIACVACGAKAGERCNRGRDPRTGKPRWRGFHFRRKDDARLATEATRALIAQR